MGSNVNIGIIGTGGMGGRHARNLAHRVNGANVVALMDPDSQRAKQVAAESNDVAVYSDANSLIASPDVDAILIAAPDHVHSELSLECIKAGKPVLCEKPLAVTVEQATKVIDAEVANGQRLLQLGFMREYDPEHQLVKQACESGDIGGMLVFRGIHNTLLDTLPRTLDWLMINSVVHDVHSGRWLMEDEIQRVNASYIPNAHAESDTVRHAMVQLYFRDGGLGVIDRNVESNYGYEVEVKGTGQLGSVQTKTYGYVADERPQIHKDWLERFETAYLNQVKAWVRSFVNGTPTGPSAWDGYVSMMVAQTCIESAVSGQPVDVQIAETPDLYTRKALKT